MKTIKALEPITAYGPDKLALFAGETAEIEDSFADALIDEGKAEEYAGGGGGGSDNVFVVGCSSLEIDPEQGIINKIILDKTWTEIYQALSSGKLVYISPIVLEDVNLNFYVVYNMQIVSGVGIGGPNVYGFIAISTDGVSRDLLSYQFDAASANDYPVYERDQA